MPTLMPDLKIKGYETPEQRLKLYQELEKIIDVSRYATGAPIRILQQVQEMCGYLPAPALDLVARELQIPISRLYSILTFYHFFTLVPKGKYVIQVCKGTACYVKGGQKILDILRRAYGLEPGGITSDGKFSLDMVRCLGCCGLSPVMAVAGDIHRKVRPASVEDILSSYR